MSRKKSTLSADGEAGARRAAAFLGIAACAEATASTMSEDAAKVDVKFSFRHAFLQSKLITVHAQIKSGRSYRLPSSSDDQINLRIDSKTKEALSGSGMPGLVVWVPPPPVDRLYWWAADTRRGLPSAKVTSQQYIRPSIRYDLTRLFEYASWSRRFAAQTVSGDNGAVMARARLAYAELKAGSWKHPLLGDLQITRLAWRHVTRRSKTAARRITALRAVPYLKAFLSKPPDRIVVVPDYIKECGDWAFERRYILCWYREALNIDGQSHSLMLRVREDISYPARWENRPLAVAEIEQKATLASWWCKKDK